MSSRIYQLTKRRTDQDSLCLTLDKGRIMGIINCTPDSFFIGSRYQGHDAIRTGIRMLDDGAELLDVGGQSTRPGAEEIGAQAEWERIEAPLKGILDARPEALISIDTFHAEVAHRALEHGAFMINDVSAGLKDEEMISVVLHHQAPFAIMHMQGTPANMQDNPQYRDVVTDVLEWLEIRLTHLRNAGVNQLVADVGFGFGKTLEHNYALLNELNVFSALNCPLLVGISRKSMIWRALESSPEDALNGTTALHAWALERGGHILRVHDVTAAREVVELHAMLTAS